MFTVTHTEELAGSRALSRHVFKQQFSFTLILTNRRVAMNFFDMGTPKVSSLHKEDEYYQA